MEFQDFAQVLHNAVLSGPNVFVRFEPEVLDFTDKQSAPILSIQSPGKTSGNIALTEDILPLVLDILQISVFSKGRKVICWNWKNFQSYSLAMTKREYRVEASIVDLKVIEQYSGLYAQKTPKSFGEALKRLKGLISSKAWEESQDAYRAVWLPLITEVVPHMETSGILDLEIEDLVYSYYEVCGQENGRFLCSREYSKGYVPHTLGPTERENLKPRSQDELFMYFDYRNMEVSMLAWLSQDEHLLELLGRKDDFYSNLYELVIGNPCSGPEFRNRSKKFFLPVIYGQGTSGLSKSLKVTEHTADQIINRLNNLFPEAFSWLQTKQEQTENDGYAKDIFGKRRYFTTSDEHKRRRQIRNFYIQSPASLVCLENLIRLYRKLHGNVDIAYHVHDGYVVYARKDNWRKVFLLGDKTLSEESQLCPGLKLSVTCKVGRSLEKLNPIARKKGDN